jgi:hypothetical protein
MRLRSHISLLLALIASCSIWVYVQFIFIPHQKADASKLQIPRGNLSDLYPRWLGARELLLHGRDPYAADITREIQIGYYGRPLDPARPHDPKDQEGFAYPVYVIFLLAPSIGLPFSIVQKLCLWFLLGITAASVLMWMDVLAWRVSLGSQLIWILLTVSSFPAIQGIKLQQLSLLVAALLAWFAYLLTRGRWAWAGVVLAMTTIKPQLAFLPVVLVCIWVLGDWGRRQRILWAFGISVAVLVMTGEVVLPGWIHEFRAALSAYYQYTGGVSILDVALSPVVGKIAAIALVAIFIALAWPARAVSERSPQFQWLLSLSLAVTITVIPMFAPYNQVLLLPGLMVIVRSLAAIWKCSTISRLVVVLTAAAVFEQWLAAIFLVFALFFLPSVVLQTLWGLPFYSSLAIPVTVLALLLMSRGTLLNAPIGAMDVSRTLQRQPASE